MPYRKTIFANNEIYHVVNRGVNHAPIFNNRSDYKRFVSSVDFSRYEAPMSYSHFSRLRADEREDFLKSIQKEKPLVSIIAFCLMPNHYHLLLKQNKDKGIQIFMRNLQNSYAKYFNTKYERSGPLFQSAFKSVRIETNEQLSHVSRYIHLNPSSSYVIEINDLEVYKFSSFNNFLGKNIFKFIVPDDVLENFDSIVEYKEFVFNHAEYQRELDIIKHLVLEDL